MDFIPKRKAFIEEVKKKNTKKVKEGKESVYMCDF
jgi:hypothetical protein